MDPNNNPTPTPNPVPNPVPNPTPDFAPTTPSSNFTSTPTPTPNPTVAAAPFPQPSQQPSTQPTMPASEVFESETNKTFPDFNISATDPITQPEPAPAPDPVEEALKAPFQAAGPVPGSIGSAISMPSSETGATPSNPMVQPTSAPGVSFNDPANEPNINQATQPVAQTPKKKSSRGALIALIIIAIILIAGLGTVLYMSMTGNDIFNLFSGTTSKNVVIKDETVTKNDSAAKKTTATLSCNYTMTVADLSENAEATSGTKTIEAKFENDKLTSLIYTTDIVMKDTALNPAQTRLIATAEQIDATNAADYLLTVDKDTQEIDLSYDAISKNYTELDFICEKL